MIDEGDHQLVLLDITMPYVSGEEILSHIQQHRPEIQVLVISGNNDLDLAIRCIQKGALDYLLKPIDPFQLLTSVRNALEASRLFAGQRSLTETFFSKDLRDPAPFEAIITQCPEMFKVMQYIEAVAPSDQPVLVLGETGMGKDLIAEAIHKASGLDGEFVTVNVNEFDDSMLIDALFGHAKGSFTGAAEARKGLLERAEGGTIFLDEIGDLDLNQQVKLLRLIQNREYRPIGSDEMKKTNARFVVATNVSLKASVQEGTFRKDLFYRLQTHEIRVPALRERQGDVSLLTRHFSEQFSEQYEKQLPNWSSKTLDLLSEQAFEGNVRELKQLILDLVLTFPDDGELHRHVSDRLQHRLSDPLEAGDLQDELVFPETMPTLKELSDMAIAEVLKRANGKQSMAAKLLGITASALSQRLSRVR